MAEAKTGRPTVPDLEAVLGKEYPVLDKGFIRIIDYMGDDRAIVDAARVSYGGGTKRLRQDEDLIRFLTRHRHTTPFEACDIKFHIKLPIFVARQWIRHRTASVNEISGRYSILKDEFYLPSMLRIQSKDGRQESQSKDSLDAETVKTLFGDISEQAYRRYRELLSENAVSPAMARELARVILPLNLYTEWYWKSNLHNLFHFLELRRAKNAQHEIREYAQQIEKIVALWVPTAYRAFLDYRANGVHLSESQANVLRAKLNGRDVDEEELSDRERRDLEKWFK